MKNIPIQDRFQIEMHSLDQMVAEQSVARLIDVFLDYVLQLDHGFKSSKRKTGRPSYPLRSLLAIYVYGYLNRLRSSRQLEHACQTNIELWWLTGKQMPCYRTICQFRVDNKVGFRKLFVHYREFCLQLDLYGRQRVAIDGSKFRAQNSKKNNFNEAKIKRQLEYIDTKTQEYLLELDEQDEKEALSNSAGDKRLTELNERKIKYEDLRDQLKQSGQTQVSTSDPDARALPIKMNIVEVGYNNQIAVDDKHNLLVEYEVTNENDINALHPMAVKCKEALNLKEEDSLTTLADKSYCKAEQIPKCHEDKIDTLVAVKDVTDRSKAAHVRKDKFEYEKQTDTYRCPNNQKLEKQSRYKKRRKGKLVSEFDRYTIKYSVCKECPYFEDCVSDAKKKSSHGRSIDRSAFQDAFDLNRKNTEKRKTEYRRRQAMVEHPFGTIKRGWGFGYTLLKGKEKVGIEFSIIFLCYNLRRTMTILGINGLKQALKSANWIVFVLRRWELAGVRKF